MSATEESLALLVALVPYLIDRGRSTVAEAAAHFDVDEDEIRTGVRLLAVSGIPDRDGNVYANDMFDIAWDEFEEHDIIELTQLVALESSPRLGVREASALIAGLELVVAAGQVDREAALTLQAKLRRAATGAREPLTIERKRVSVASEAIRHAIERHEVVELDYRKPGEATATRRIAPQRLELIDDAVFVRAFDLDRAALRSFRADRIQAVRETGELAPETAVIEIDAPVFEQSADGIDVLVESSTEGAALLERYVTAPNRRLKDGRVQLTIGTGRLDAVVRAIAALGGEAVIVGPPAARRHMREFAERARAAYVSSDDPGDVSG